MPQFLFDADDSALRELNALPAMKDRVVFDPADPDVAIFIVRPIPRQYGAHVMRLFDRLRLVDQEPPVSAEPGADLLRQHLLRAL